MILQLRQKLKKYKDILYIAYMVLFGVLVSGGFNSADRAYKVVFVLCGLLWASSLVLTDFSLNEILAVTVTFVFLGLTAFRNGEKTLILTAMAITGAKDSNLLRMFRWSFWAKIAVTLELLLLVCLGFVENDSMKMVKGSVTTYIHMYGYNHPNKVFMNILTILFLFILAYGDGIRWYGYVIMTAVVAAAYKILLCRTGLVVWVAYILAMLLYALVKKTRLRKVYLYLYTAIPPVLSILTAVLIRLYNSENSFGIKIDELLHSRIKLASQKPIEGLNLFGSFERNWFDNGYYHLVYNYGYVFAIICMAVYAYAIVLLVKTHKDNEVIILGCTAVLVFMEYAGLSVCWCYAWVYLYIVLFRKREWKKEEGNGQENYQSVNEQ